MIRPQRRGAGRGSSAKMMALSWGAAVGPQYSNPHRPVSVQTASRNAGKPFSRRNFSAWPTTPRACPHAVLGPVDQIVTPNIRRNVFAERTSMGITLLLAAPVRVKERRHIGNELGCKNQIRCFSKSLVMQLSRMIAAFVAPQEMLSVRSSVSVIRCPRMRTTCFPERIARTPLLSPDENYRRLAFASK